MSESFWKKEIRLRKKPEPMPPLPARLLEQARTRTERPRGTVTVPVIPQRESRERIESWPPPAPAAERPAIVEFPRPAAGEGQDPVALLPASAPVDPAPVTPMPQPPAPVSSFEWARAVAEPVAETESLETPPEETTFALPLPMLVSDTETVSDTPEPELSPAEKVPLLKREIKLGRRPKPKAEKVAKPKKEPKAKRASRSAGDKTPLLKREITFRRTQKTKAAPAETPPLEAPQAKEKKPLLKRELSFRRAPKAESATNRTEHAVKRVVGLRIGASQLAAAHVRNNGSAELVQLARQPIDRGLVVGGEVRDAEGLTRALKAFFADNKLPRKDVRLGIASNRIGVRMLELPAIDDAKQFENALRFRAQELLPIPIGDAILDHVVLEEWVNDDGEALRRVLVVFAHRELVNRFVDVCRDAGVRLAGIDLDPFALLRAIAAPLAEDADPANAVVAVAIGHDRTIVAVSDGRVCDFTRVLEWGGSSLDVAIARTLNLTPSQAEPVKRGLDLDGDGVPEEMSAVQLEVVKDAVRSEIAVLGRELVSSLRFYQSRPDSLAIGEVLLAGGTAQLAGLAAELRQIVGAPVRIADPFARVVMGKKLHVPENPSSLAIAVGLGIED